MRLLLALALLLPTALSAQLLDAKVLAAEGARRIAAATEAEARKNGWNVSIAVVDAAGQLLHFHKMDDASPGSIEVAQKKARTAARYKRETRLLDSALVAGRAAYLAFPDLMPVEGGVPIVIGGKVIGAVGVSGATSAQDAQAARAGIAELR